MLYRARTVQRLFYIQYSTTSRVCTFQELSLVLYLSMGIAWKRCRPDYNRAVGLSIN